GVQTCALPISGSFWGSNLGAAATGAAAGAAAGASASTMVDAGCSVAAGAAACASPALSPSARTSAIGVLTFTPSVPSATRISLTTPSSTDSTSIVALSVSISANTSPDFTVSPTLTSHLASLPSSIVGERAGIRIWGISALQKFYAGPMCRAAGNQQTVVGAGR